MGYGKGFRIRKEYYFSVGPAGEILALTLNNLNHAFQQNYIFRDSLEATFRRGQSLAEYDESHKIFMVNRILIASRKP